MSTELLKVALRQPEKIASPLAKSLLSSAGSGLGAAGTFKLLSALRPELAEAALWGGVGAGGVLGHDVARHLANKAKVAAWAKKKAAMEKPFKTEYSLTKKASVARKLTDIAYKSGLKAPSLSTQAGYGLLQGVPQFGASVAGGVGGNLLAKELAPHIGVKGFYAAETLPEILANLGLGAIGTLGGIELGSRLGGAAGKSLSKKIMPETARYMRIADPYKLASFTKQANLSRAAKGAIGLPLGVMGAAAIHPELFGVLPSSLGGHLSDTIGSNILNSLDNLAKPLLGSSSHQLANVGTSLAGLSALGAGAGKLSGRAIPVAKKSITDNPTARKAALAAALFPWTLAVGGGAYLLGKNSSDS